MTLIKYQIEISLEELANQFIKHVYKKEPKEVKVWLTEISHQDGRLKGNFIGKVIHKKFSYYLIYPQINLNLTGVKASLNFRYADKNSVKFNHLAQALTDKNKQVREISKKVVNNEIEGFTLPNPHNYFPRLDELKEALSEKYGLENIHSSSKFGGYIKFRKDKIEYVTLIHGRKDLSKYTKEEIFEKIEDTLNLDIPEKDTKYCPDLILTKKDRIECNTLREINISDEIRIGLWGPVSQEVYQKSINTLKKYEQTLCNYLEKVYLTYYLQDSNLVIGNGRETVVSLKHTTNQKLVELLKFTREKRKNNYPFNFNGR